MSTPHNTAEKGQIASTVLMPGDPLRAKYIAETYLDNVSEFNHVRGMLGFTGTYQGKPVSVMGSGMGIPSIGIYSYELFHHYGVDNIIRLGSSGSYVEGLNLFDVVMANINRNILLEDMKLFRSVMNMGGTLILSGFYEEDVPVLLEKADELGLHEITRQVDNNWTCLVLGA